LVLTADTSLGQCRHPTLWLDILSLVRLVLSQSLRPVGIGLAAGGGLAAAVAILLMATPAASEIGGTVNVLDPVAYAASLLVIVTSCLLAAFNVP
jgi:hypothetical protein